jgi:hypothetical protein
LLNVHACLSSLPEPADTDTAEMARDIHAWLSRHGGINYGALQVGFTLEGSGLRVEDRGCRRCTAPHLVHGFRVWGTRFRVQRSGFRIKVWVQGLGFRG